LQEYNFVKKGNFRGINRLLSVWRVGIAALAAGMVLGAAPARAYEVLTPLLDVKNQINSRRAQSHLVIKATVKISNPWAPGKRTGRSTCIIFWNWKEGGTPLSSTPGKRSWPSTISGCAPC
jgi:hypothetical protein